MLMRSSDSKIEKELELKVCSDMKAELLKKNKEKARILLLGAMSESSISERRVKHNYVITE